MIIPFADVSPAVCGDPDAVDAEIIAEVEGTRLVIAGSAKFA